MRSYRYRCPWCGEFRSREEMRGRVGGTGPVPCTCQRCRDDNPDLAWCKYHGVAHPITDFPRREGRGPEAMCHRAAYEKYEAPDTRVCPWCGERKTVPEMKGHPPGTRGKAPTTCHSCRISHPDEAWCTFHQAAHLRVEFDYRGRSVPDSWCKLARHESRYPHIPPVQCPSCGELKPSGAYMGRGRKKPVCKQCVGANPDMKWCTGCPGWRELGLFPSAVGSTGARCLMCISANRHNTTVAAILQVQGAEYPLCESCGSRESLNVDHDHSCCPGANSCGRCVLGYLCWRCNSAEGQLATVERAFALAEHMVRREKKIAARK